MTFSRVHCLTFFLSATDTSCFDIIAMIAKKKEIFAEPTF